LFQFIGPIRTIVAHDKAMARRSHAGEYWEREPGVRSRAELESSFVRAIARLLPEAALNDLFCDVALTPEMWAEQRCIACPPALLWAADLADYREVCRQDFCRGRELFLAYARGQVCSVSSSMTSVAVDVVDGLLSESSVDLALESREHSDDGGPELHIKVDASEPLDELLARVERLWRWHSSELRASGYSQSPPHRPTATDRHSEWTVRFQLGESRYAIAKSEGKRPQSISEAIEYIAQTVHLRLRR
jgi:hypothetical protein